MILSPLPTQAISVQPNDPHFFRERYAPIIELDQAWGYSTGSPDVIVAVIDSGVDLDHPDLKDNIWINSDEIPDNNLDDDHNGFIDDVYGWNFVENNNDPNPQFANYSTEGASHGTLVAGIIAASGNNAQGITGVSWRSKIMALRALDSKGSGFLDDAAKAIRYATANGASIINMSFVGQESSNKLDQAIREAYAANVVLIAAIGNDAAGAISNLDGGDLDHAPVYPACFSSEFSDYVIGVGATDLERVKADFSNYGQNCLDINAPGVEIISTQVLNPPLGLPFTAPYSGLWDGTSFSAPQVSGVAALIKSINNQYTNKEIQSLLLDTADSLDAQNPGLVGELGRGMLNARRAVRAAAPANFIPFDPVAQQAMADQNAAVWLSDQISATARINDSLAVGISFKNKGQLTWSPAALSIRITDWQNGNCGFSRCSLRPANVAQILPGQTVDFNDSLLTPAVAGDYKLKFQLYYQNDPVKGGALYKTITLQASNQTIITEANVPVAVLKKWGQVNVRIKIQNQTANTWRRSDLKLKLKKSPVNWLYGGTVQPNETTVPPGGYATFPAFIINFTALSKGVQTLTFELQTNSVTTVPIIGGERLIRID